MRKKIPSSQTPQATHPAPADPDPAHTEILRIIGNARAEHNVCVMARGRYGLREFGRLFYLLENVPNQKLGAYLDEVDAARSGHCLKCSLKILAFCRFYCRNRLEQRRETYILEYEEELAVFGPGRDFFDEVAYAIKCSKPQPPPTPPPQTKKSRLRQRVFPTDIRQFRGDFEE